LNHLPLSTSGHEHLWDRTTPTGKALVVSLTALTEAIAIDCLNPELFTRLFRRDTLIAALVRHFLLAQYLLRPYRVHPVSYPEIPDMSLHPLWRQWALILDSAMSPAPSPRAGFFPRAAATVAVLLDNGQFNLVRPYHLALLFHMLAADESNDEPVLLLSRFAVGSRVLRDVLVRVTFFVPLFHRLITCNPRSPTFQPLADLALVLIHLNEAFANDVSQCHAPPTFPHLCLDETLPFLLRVSVAVLVATLVPTHGDFQRVCTSGRFLTALRRALPRVDAPLAIWLLITLRRSFSCYSPDLGMVGPTGLHLQIAVMLRSGNTFVRSGALAVLACFMSPFDCKYNFQLFFLALHPADLSYHVRFHFVLVIKKLLLSLDLFPERPPRPPGARTFTGLFASVLGPREGAFAAIDRLMRRPDCRDVACDRAIFLLTQYEHDPHPSVRGLVAKIFAFADRRCSTADVPDTARMDLINGVLSFGDEELEAEAASIADIDQNQSLFRIARRHHLDTRTYPTPPFELRPAVLQAEVCHAVFEPDGGLAAAASKRELVALTGDSVVYPLEDREVADVAVVGCGLVLVVTRDGCVVGWRVPLATPWLIARVHSRIGVVGDMYVRNLGSGKFAVARADGVVGVWDWERKLLVREIDLGVEICAFDVGGSEGVVGKRDGGIVVFNFENERSETIEAVERMIEVRKDELGIWGRTEQGMWLRYSNGKWEAVGANNGRRFYVGRGRFANWDDGRVLVTGPDGAAVMQFAADAPVTAFALDEKGRRAVIGNEAGTVEICHAIP
jgi:hypothetical protein